MPPSEAILAAVARLDMLELTSRIITNPERNAPRASVAEVYAFRARHRGPVGRGDRGAAPGLGA